MKSPVEIEGFENQSIEVQQTGLFARARLFANGQPVPRGIGPGEMILTRDDGIEAIARWKPRFLEMPRLEINGKVIDIVKPLKWYQWAWSALPILLILIGGIFGALAGFLAFIINIHIFRSNLRSVFQFACTALISMLAVILYLALSILLLSVFNA